MILNFAFSELHFTHHDKTISIWNRINDKVAKVKIQNKDHLVVMDIQETLIYTFNISSIDRSNFDKIQEYVRSIVRK